MGHTERYELLYKWLAHHQKLILFFFFPQNVNLFPGTSIHPKAGYLNVPHSKVWSHDLYSSTELDRNAVHFFGAKSVRRDVPCLFSTPLDSKQRVLNTKKKTAYKLQGAWVPEQPSRMLIDEALLMSKE